MKLIVAFPFLLLSACGNPLGGSHSDIGADHQPGIASAIAPGAGAEMVSLSSQSKLTNNARFLIQGSVSSASSQLKQSTPRGYVLYSNVQGELISGGK